MLLVRSLQCWPAFYWTTSIPSGEPHIIPALPWRWAPETACTLPFLPSHQLVYISMTWSNRELGTRRECLAGSGFQQIDRDGMAQRPLWHEVLRRIRWLSSSVSQVSTQPGFREGFNASRLLSWKPVRTGSPFSTSRISFWCRLDEFAPTCLDCHLVVTLCRKWLSPFCRSNIRPDHADSNFHDFKMHTFTRVTSCRVCQMLLR